MRYLYTLLIALLVCFSSYAQDPQIFENDWYLHNLIIGGVDFIPPVNEEIPYIPAIFHSDGGFQTGMCESGGAGYITYTGATEFTLNNMAWLLGGCYENEPFNEMYNWQYQSYWNESPNFFFNYEIIYEGQNKTLIITNLENSIAIFGDDLLSIIDVNQLTFYIYPNPIQDLLNIENTNSNEINVINIYDVLGRLVLEEKKPSNQLDISNLESGLLFLTIETNKGVFTKKIIKQ